MKANVLFFKEMGGVNVSSKLMLLLIKIISISGK